MRYFYFLFVFVLIGCKSTSVSNETSTVSYKVQQSSVSAILKTLTTDEMQGRKSGTEGINKAATYLIGLMQQYNVKPYFKTYRDTLTNFKGTTFNIVGVIDGDDPILRDEFIILGAHYDHIGISEKGIEGDFINNGANDDASGVTAVSELANYFGANKTNIAYKLKFDFFNFSAR